ncbi:DUF302 domain-containing protein [Cupriavidus oxalaticus]|uniref:DUF302 domain-containing protein n=1 Tax=Cupriavidus oxalaticus TaxID=96344 RepID=UPI0031761E21
MLVIEMGGEMRLRHAFALALSVALIMPQFAAYGADPATGQANPAGVQASSQPVSIVHRTLELRIDYEAFTRSFESVLGKFDRAVMASLASDPEGAEIRMARMEGEQGLMIFAAQDHGALFAMTGSHRKARRYHVGNPRIALQMTSLDIRAGLYAPLSLLVYETEPGVVKVDFDQPSTLFGQFGNPAVTAIGLALDRKLAIVIQRAAQLAAQQ